jgi:hypothetical protein
VHSRVREPPRADAAIETAAEAERQQMDIGLGLAEAEIGEAEADKRRAAADEAELTAEFLPGLFHGLFGRGHVTRTHPPPVREGAV